VVYIPHPPWTFWEGWNIYNWKAGLDRLWMRGFLMAEVSRWCFLQLTFCRFLTYHFKGWRLRNRVEGVSMSRILWRGRREGQNRTKSWECYHLARSYRIYYINY
jgi:hypothetical protein